MDHRTHRGNRIIAFELQVESFFRSAKNEERVRVNLSLWVLFVVTQSLYLLHLFILRNKYWNISSLNSSVATTL